MQVLPIQTPQIKPGDSVADILAGCFGFSDSDILLVSSKVIAMAEGRIFDLKKIKTGEEALKLAPQCGQEPEFTELVLRETERMNGFIASISPFALLTSLKPAGMKTGRLLCPNAGLDKSNIEPGYAIGWPEDPVRSVRILRMQLELSGRKPRNPKKPTKPKIGSLSSDSPLGHELEVEWSDSSVSSVSSRIAVIITDSCCRPARLGVVAFALVCTGIDPAQSQIGKKDLFGKPLNFTHEAVADQLATAANFVMGNAGQSVPAAVIRDHGIELSDYSGWVDGINPGEDLFKETIV